MQDFLTFKTFIGPTVLMLMYIFGAILMPLMAWVVAQKIKRYLPFEVEHMKKSLFFAMRLRERVLFLVIVLFVFSAMEICWRMMFEFLVAYMQMHDALVGGVSLAR